MKHDIDERFRQRVRIYQSSYLSKFVSNYQSKNILITEANIYVIDYRGENPEDSEVESQKDRADVPETNEKPKEQSKKRRKEREMRRERQKRRLRRLKFP